MSDYDQYCDERSNPRFLVCPAPGTWFQGSHGNWDGEQWSTCPKCDGFGEIRAEDWDEME